MRVVIILLILSAAVAIHEFGHAVAMVGYGVPVKEFAVGMGPVLWDTTTDGGTIVSLRTIPLGGFTEPDADALERLPWLALVNVFMFGMLLNVVVAFFLLSLVRFIRYERPLFFGNFLEIVPPTLRPIWSAFVDSFIAWLVMPPYIAVMLVVKRSKFFKEVASPIGIIAGTIGDDDEDEEEQEKRPEPIPAVPRPKRKPMHPFLGLIHGLLSFFCMINVGIAGFNLLPLFPLDGGRIAVLLIEVFEGPKAAGIYAVISTVLFVLFVVAIFASDIRKLFRRHS